MKIYNYIPGKAIPEAATAIALGFFDGVHAAHRRLLDRARRLAKEMALTFAVFTFPSENGFKGGRPLYSTEEKLALLEKAGVEAVIIADFSEVSEIDAEDFIENSLIADMSCRAAVAGYDFRFGRGAAGDAGLLLKKLSESGAVCEIENEYRIDGEKVSTTRIKEFLALGNADKAREFLGSPYFITADVTKGNGVGKKLGFPTVNTAFKENTTPLAHGVYRTAIDISGRLYSGITNVGICPTFEAREPHAETFILDFSGDLYGQKIRIFFLEYLREEKKFDNPKDLILQINIDKNRVIQENGELLWQEIGQS